jgi:chromosome segregation ATPase
MMHRVSGDLLQQLAQLGSAFGPVAAGAVGWLSRAVKRITSDVTLAQANALMAKGQADTAQSTASGLADAIKRAQTIADEAKTLAAGLADAFASMRRGVRMEVNSFKEEVNSQIRTMVADLDNATDDGPAGALLKKLHRETIVPLDERLVNLEEKQRSIERTLRSSRPEFPSEEETGRFVAIRTTMDHEQEQRRALQETLVGHMRDEAERWLRLERTMGNTEAKMEAWSNQAERLQRQLEDQQRTLDTLRRGR